MSINNGIAYVKKLVGAPYKWWTGGKLQKGPPFYMVDKPPPSVEYIFQHGINCFGLINIFFRASDIETIQGGTAKFYKEFKDISEKYDDNKNYPIGTIIGRNYKNIRDQGHVALCIGNDKIIEAYPSKIDFKETKPGVTISSMKVSNKEGAKVININDNYYTYAVTPDMYLSSTF